MNLWHDKKKAAVTRLSIHSQPVTRYTSVTISCQVPQISIIMPCYNARSTVARAVMSIVNQTISDWELIVVDDGSTDGSAELIKKIAQTDSRIRLIQRDHRGVVAASNHGFSMAQPTPLIARMDADDVSHPSRLARQSHALANHPELGGVSCLVRFAGDHETAAGYAHHVQWTNRHVSAEAVALNRFIDLPVPHPTLMYRREVVEHWGGYRDGDFPEDYEMFLRWLAGRVRIGKVNETLYDWYDPPTRLSRNDPRYDMMAFHQCKAPYLAQAIHDSGCSHRALWIAGAGRPARKCANPLEQSWKPASGFIDVDPRKIGRMLHGRPVVAMTALPPINQSVIVSYVGSRGAGDRIRDALKASGRIEGIDFWIAA
ncbi:MAG: glycosyltransferase [Verrucomicrobiae bacterium]|nr:glycosyltransferase [Verrucomicrobiae bacterium]NNJ42994.1 glycosyltransferase family 2 protein [Akkermansiaceae bacterium]